MLLLLNDSILALVLAAVLLFCFAVAILIVKLPEIRWRLANSPEMIEAERRAREERTRNPNWDFYERHLQRPVPTRSRTCSTINRRSSRRTVCSRSTERKSTSLV